MCLTFFRTFAPPSLYQFVLCFNRDEAYLRETLPFNYFSEDPNIYAGRDTISRGTWLGINIKTGLIVILTNYDDPEFKVLKSRGQMVYRFLSSKTYQNCLTPQQIDQRVTQTLQQIQQSQQDYSPFNLCLYNIRTNRITYLNNKTNSKLRNLQNDVNYGLCNIDIDTIWSKTSHGLSIFKEITAKISDGNLSKAEDTIQQLYNLMRDNTKFQIDQQRQSSIFINPYYSQQLKQERMTKSTTFILVNREMEILVQEVSYKRQECEEAGVVNMKLGLVDL